MEKLTAVYDDDLEEFLNNIGIAKDIEKKRIHCRVCDVVITYDNFLAAFPIDGQIYLCCNNDECLKEINKSDIG